MAQPEPTLGYADAAQVYWDKGWRGVLPLNRGAKWPPPKGFTGYDGRDPSYADVLQWSELYPSGNICLRLPDGVIGIDVDAYGAKTGAAAFAEAVRRWGPLPNGPQSSSREDDTVSGLRLFRVPPGTLLEDVVVFSELAIGDIEVIQRHHRYVVCWPSIHPEGRSYWWRNASGQLLGIPEVSEIPDLPQPWLDGLKMTPRSLEVNTAEFDTRQALTAGYMSPVVSARLVQAIKELNLPGMARHDTCLRNVMALLRHGREGQPGVETALSQLRQVFIAVTSIDNSRSPNEAIDEFNRMVTNRNVARELAQPGILDWFKQVMDGVQELNSPPPADDPDAQNANANRAEDDGAAAPAANAEDAAGPPEPNSGGELERLEQDFWEVRPQHAIIYAAALAGMTSPWAVFACCVARTLALVPPSITLPPLIGGGGGSLNWFGVLSAKSGGGKGTAMSVAEALVPNMVNEHPVGSGEGMVECYNRAPAKGENPPPPVVSVMFTIEEIDTLSAMGSRSGQTIMPLLRQGFSGERLGFTYRGRKDAVAKQTYRMTLIASVQPSRAGVLLDDSGGGTPQRFMWFPGKDRRITEDIVEWPVDNLGMRMAISGYFPKNWEIAAALGFVPIPEEASQAIRRERAAQQRGDDNALNTHAMFAREKMAFALAFMDGRLEINSEDWRLSGIVADVSDWSRDRTIAAYQESKDDEARDRGQQRGIESAAADLEKLQEQERRIQRVTDKVLSRIRESMPGGISQRDLTRRVPGRDQGLVKAALEYMASQGWITQVEGTTTWVMR